ncbi:MAG: cysteine desulfurase family protein [Bacteroidales bacterium]
MKGPVYLDYNATTPVDRKVSEAMLPFVHGYFGNPSSSYEPGRKAKEAIEKAREQTAGLIQASPDEIIFTSGGTESNNHALRGAAFKHQEKGRHIITSSIEHPSVKEVCKYLESVGFEITWLPVNHSGTVNIGDVEEAIRPDTILISIMHANNEVGSIQPVEEIASLARENDILFHTDASQSAGKISVNVEDLSADMLTIAGHKLYAPKGIGALYIRNGISIDNLLFGGGQENGIRPGTENTSQIVGLGKAAETARQELDANRKHMWELREHLVEGLINQMGNQVILNTHLDNSLPNTLSVAFDKVEAHTLASLLSSDVLISTGSACHAEITEISPVLEAMNVKKMTAAGTVRISIGKYTTTEEIDLAIRAITQIVRKLS